MFKLILNTFLNRTNTIHFNPKSNIIEVPVLLKHGDRELYTNFALDTGATYTVIDDSLALFLELDLSRARNLEVASASGNTTAKLTEIDALYVLEHRQQDAPVIVTDLPEDSGITGLLGLSFLREHKMTINFTHGVLKFF